MDVKRKAPPVVRSLSADAATPAYRALQTARSVLLRHAASMARERRRREDARELLCLVDARLPNDGRVAREPGQAGIETWSQAPNACAFAQEVLEASSGLQYGIDGDEIQQMAAKHGLLVASKPTEPCGEACRCAEDWGGADFAAGRVVCYRRRI